MFELTTINNVSITQLACEFNRIMGRDVAADINYIWQTAFPKIISIAKEEGIENHNISNMMTGLPMDMPNGKLSHLVFAISTYLISINNRQFLIFNVLFL